MHRTPPLPIAAIAAVIALLLAAAVATLQAPPARAIAATLANAPNASSGAASPAPPPGFRLGGDAMRGRQLYAANCAACHGPAGDGRGEMAVALVPKPTDLTNAAHMAKRSDWDLYRIIRDGGQVVGLSPSMAGYQPLLSDADLRSVAAFVRGLTKRPAPRR